MRAAVNRMFAPSGWRELEWDFADDALVASHPEHGRLPVRFLSDGIRNMIGLVGDIAHRTVRMNPHLGAEAPLRTPGIVLIDEVDMHLHPAWQQTVVPSLLEAFPAMQLIVTTHSPHVLSTVDVASIRVVRVEDGRGVFRTPTFQSRGVASADVLAAIMGVDPVPPVEEARSLGRYRGMIEDGQADTPEAQALRHALVTHFGAQHPVILDCDRARGS